VCRCDALHALERLDAALRLLGLARRGAKALDERLHMPDLALLACVERGLLGEFRRAVVLEGGVVAAIDLSLALFDVEDAVDDAVEELAIVRDQQQRARILAQPGLEPQDGVQVQVIGRFVEQQQVRTAHQRLRHVQPHAPAARERPHRPRLIGRDEAKTMHELRGAAARVVTTRGGVSRVEIGEPRTVVVALLDLGNSALDRTQLGVAVQHEIQRRLVGGFEFLRHMRDREVAGHLEMSGVGRELAAHQRHQAGLAAAVLAGDADLFAAKQAERRVGKEDARAAPQSDVVELDHGGRKASPSFRRAASAR